mmetsp:Transcript_137703/g.427833  ORF Transcript_137703/g.427833 Transcript_137703/m.427833 type:complete len:205 (-) Transcript_137703:178-792(-)
MRLWPAPGGEPRARTWTSAVPAPLLRSWEWPKTPRAEVSPEAVVEREGPPDPRRLSKGTCGRSPASPHEGGNALPPKFGGVRRALLLSLGCASRRWPSSDSSRPCSGPSPRGGVALGDGLCTASAWAAAEIGAEVALERPACSWLCPPKPIMRSVMVCSHLAVSTVLGSIFSLSAPPSAAAASARRAFFSLMSCTDASHSTLWK